jgi:signal transduction histidine kinase
MQSYEKDYLLTRQGSRMQSAFNVAVLLRYAITHSPNLDANQQGQALAYLDDYVSVAREVLKLDVEIRSKLNEFDLQAKSIDPISEELIDLANAEVQRTRDQIASANQLATALLIVTILAAFVLASVVAIVFNNSITRNVIKLTEAAGQLRDGNLEIRAKINSADELGQLAESFNAMAARINVLVKDLEQQIVQRTATNQNLQREITERRRVEEKLRGYQEHLEELVKERTAELMQATQEAERALSAAEAANQAKSVFLATMSHELRTPLNAILGFAQILQRDAQTTPDQLEGLTLIEQSGKHLLALINDILDLAKVEAGKLDLLPAEFNLPGMLAELSHMIQIKTSQKSLTLKVELDDLPTYVYGDEKRLRGILLNLLDNAVKYTRQGQVTLKANLLRHLPDPASSRQIAALFRFTVKDTGSGIPAHALSSIFDPFQRVEISTNRVGGTGLGLTICKNLVKLMGGSLQVKSEVDQGSTFWFELVLPVAAEQFQAPTRERGQIIVLPEPCLAFW